MTNQEAIETVLNMLKEKDKEIFVTEHVNGSFKLMINERDSKIAEMSDCIDKLKKHNSELLRKLRNRVKEVKKLNRYSAYKSEFSRLNKLLAKKDKIIDEMAEYLSIIRDCPNADKGANIDCENRCSNDDNLYAECWKMYFKRKCEDE